MAVKGKAAKAAVAKRHNARMENTQAINRAAQPSKKNGATSIHTFGLPHISEAPAGARVIDGQGTYAVMLADGGRLIGMFRRI